MGCTGAPDSYDESLGWHDPQAPGVATSALLDKLRLVCADATPGNPRTTTRKVARHARHA
jgi:hypothetical protein